MRFSGHVAATFLLLLTLACDSPRQDGTPNVTSPRNTAIDNMTRQDVEGYALALEPRPFVFPEDHGPHPDFQTEWWYFTGHLDTQSASQPRAFGFQLTFFRSALAPEAIERESSWGTRQLYLAHFALSDVSGERFYAFERLSRGAAGLAGAQIDPLRVFVDDWSFSSRQADDFPWRLTATEWTEEGERITLDLEVTPGKPMVLQGDRGLSSKSQKQGNASYYYSYTRLEATGTVIVDETSFPVHGMSWLDREWGTSPLDSSQGGWDWFALQLEDGREIMHGQLRLRDGRRDPASYGTLIEADGSSQYLEAEAFELTVLDHWTSPNTGVTYPSGWRLRMPNETLDLELRPRLVDQELNVSTLYWEGALTVEGTSGGSAVRGRGYAELVGYDAARKP